jgi:hypothetical protein
MANIETLGFTPAGDGHDVIPQMIQYKTSLAVGKVLD